MKNGLSGCGTFFLFRIADRRVISCIVCSLYLDRKKRKQKYPEAVLSNESFTVLIVLSLGVALTYLARATGGGYPLYGLVIFLLSVTYGLVSRYLQSKLLWVCALLTLVISFAVQSWSWSGPQHDIFGDELSLADNGVLRNVAAVALWDKKIRN